MSIGKRERATAGGTRRGSRSRLPRVLVRSGFVPGWVVSRVPRWWPVRATRTVVTACPRKTSGQAERLHAGGNGFSGLRRRLPGRCASRPRGRSPPTSSAVQAAPLAAAREALAAFAAELVGEAGEGIALPAQGVLADLAPQTAVHHEQCWRWAIATVIVRNTSLRCGGTVLVGMSASGDTAQGFESGNRDPADSDR